MRSIRRLTFGLLLAIVGLVVLAAPALSHTGFESSDPADGASLDAPVDVITLVFTGPAEPTGDGFQVLDPSGELREPTEATTEDGSVWVLQFDPPIAGGLAGVRWMVKAPDAHPIDGSFSFTVPAALPPVVGEDPIPPAVAQDPDPPTASATTPTVSEVGSSDTDIEAFLESGSTATARRVGAMGRVIMLLGTLLGIGALVFARVILRGDSRDIRHVLHWVRRAGVLVVVGALVEFAAQIGVEGAGTWSAAVIGDVAVSSFGLAVGLRVVGGLALASGTRIDIADAAGTPDPVVALKERVGADSGGSETDGFDADSDDGPASGGAPYVHDGDHVWIPSRSSSGAMLGIIALLGAFLFDGHTVTEGPRLVTGVVDVIHVAAAAVWVGGLLMLASVLWRRHRQHREVRALQLGVRFSVVATIALVAVGLAGLILMVIILDSPSELWSTEWGRLLVAKTLLVAIAAAAGGYNHKVLIPQLDRTPGNPVLADRFRSIVTGEAAAMLAVVVLTALLMGAA